MSDVKRYHPGSKYIGSGDYVGTFEEDELGDFVSYDDYEALALRLEASEKKAADATALLKAFLLAMRAGASTDEILETVRDGVGIMIPRPPIRATPRLPGGGYQPNEPQTGESKPPSE